MSLSMPRLSKRILCMLLLLVAMVVFSIHLAVADEPFSRQDFDRLVRAVPIAEKRAEDAEMRGDLDEAVKFYGLLERPYLVLYGDKDWRLQCNQRLKEDCEWIASRPEPQRTVLLDGIRAFGTARSQLAALDTKGALDAASIADKNFNNQGRNLLRHAGLMRIIAGVHSHLGNPAEANEAADKGLNILRDIGATSDSIYFGLHSYKLLGLGQQGKMVTAIENAMEPFQQIAANRNFNGRTTRGHFLASFAEVLEYTGEHDLALDLLHAAMREVGRKGGRRRRADVNVARIELVQGKKATAMKRLKGAREAIALEVAGAPPSHPWIALMKLDVSLSLLQCSDGSEGREELLRAFKVLDSQETFFARHEALYARAWLYAQEKQWDEARQLAEEAITLGISCLTESHPRLANYYVLLARVNSKLGRVDQAKKADKEAGECRDFTKRAQLAIGDITLEIRKTVRKLEQQHEKDGLYLDRHPLSGQLSLPKTPSGG